MSATTAIQWTHHTFNPWRGCSKVHTGCANCYAEVNYSVKMHGIRWGTHAQGGTRVRLSDAGWGEPLKWNRQAEAAGERRRVFCASLADVFEDWDGPILNHSGEQLFKKASGYGTWHGNLHDNPYPRLTLDDLRRDLFRLIDQTPWLDWLLLTKRPENVLRMWPHRAGPWIKDRKACVESWRRQNCWIGTSVSDQQNADRMLPELLKCRDLAPVLFASAEPLVGPVDLFNERRNLIGDVGRHGARPVERGIDWLIVGGESGPKARPCDIAWVRSIVSQCRAAGVPVFVKQLGSRHGLNDPKGGDPLEWPVDLRVREFPNSS